MTNRSSDPSSRIYEEVLDLEYSTISLKDVNEVRKILFPVLKAARPEKKVCCKNTLFYDLKKAHVKVCGKNTFKCVY